MRRRTVYFEGIRGRTNCPGAAIRASIWGIPIEARSCLDLTAVSGVSVLLAREARHAESQLSEGRRRALQYFVSRSGADGRATAAVVAWLSGARTIRSSCRRAPRHSSETCRGRSRASWRPVTSPRRRTPPKSPRQSGTFSLPYRAGELDARRLYWRKFGGLDGPVYGEIPEPEPKPGAYAPG